jgi:Fungal chitosanase of glycosyl hydrolase group 75
MPTKIGEINGSVIRQAEGELTFCYRSGAAINADGAHHAYHPEGGKGLDYLDNAGEPGNWWGLSCDSKGDPFRQCMKDPAPGYYVSMTSLCDPIYNAASPRRFVDSETVPFIVLPRDATFGAKLGDLALVCNAATGKHCGAIFADIGPRDKIGELSIALAEALGVNPDPKIGGSESSDFLYIVFPGSSEGWPVPVGTLKARASALFTEWGGFGKLSLFYPDLIKSPQKPGTYQDKVKAAYQEQFKIKSQDAIMSEKSKGTLEVGRQTPLKTGSKLKAWKDLAPDEFTVLEPGKRYDILRVISENEQKHYRLVLLVEGKKLEGWVYINDAVIDMDEGEADGAIYAQPAKEVKPIDPGDKRAIQLELIRIGVLDGFVDGKWGAISASGYRASRRALTGSESDTIDVGFLAKLAAYPSAADLDFKAKDASNSENTLAVKLIKRMAKLGMQIHVSMGSTSPTYNIVYVSGTNPDGSRNQDSIDNWNDLRFLIQVAQDGTVSVPLCKVATVDAGRYWRENPMNSAGCAQIDKDKQFLAAWCVGRHGSRQYPALVQCGEVSITRDLNRAGLRDSADKHFSGADFGINQHHGYDSDTIGQMSAGCLVGRSIAGHELFMSLLCKDRRYQCSNGYAWATAVFDGANI